MDDTRMGELGVVPIPTPPLTPSPLKGAVMRNPICRPCLLLFPPNSQSPEEADEQSMSANVCGGVIFLCYGNQSHCGDHGRHTHGQKLDNGRRP